MLQTHPQTCWDSKWVSVSHLDQQKHTRAHVYSMDCIIILLVYDSDLIDQLAITVTNLQSGMIPLLWPFRGLRLRLLLLRSFKQCQPRSWWHGYGTMDMGLDLWYSVVLKEEALRMSHRRDISRHIAPPYPHQIGTYYSPSKRLPLCFLKGLSGWRNNVQVWPGTR